MSNKIMFSFYEDEEIIYFDQKDNKMPVIIDKRMMNETGKT